MPCRHYLTVITLEGEKEEHCAPVASFTASYRLLDVGVVEKLKDRLINSNMGVESLCETSRVDALYL